MATVTGLTKERMEAIEAASVVDGEIDGSGHLILTRYDATTIDAGSALPALPDASETTKGIVELATSAEGIAGTDPVTAITPAVLAAVLDAFLATKIYPVGSYYTSDVSTDPATKLGFGTWSAVGGRILIGANGTYVAGTEAGSATHTIGTTNLPAHTHSDGTLATASEAAHTHANGTLTVGSEASHTHADGTYAAASAGSHTHHIESDLDGASGGSVYSVHRGGGEGTHNSDPTSSTGSHTHDVTGTSGAGSSHTHSVTGSTAAGSSHSHDVTGATGSGPGTSTAINHMPPHRAVYMWRRTA